MVPTHIATVLDPYRFTPLRQNRTLNERHIFAGCVPYVIYEPGLPDYFSTAPTASLIGKYNASASIGHINMASLLLSGTRTSSLEMRDTMVVRFVIPLPRTCSSVLTVFRKGCIVLWRHAWGTTECHVLISGLWPIYGTARQAEGVKQRYRCSHTD